MQSERRNERLEITKNHGNGDGTLNNSVMEFSKNMSRADLAGKFGGNESKADISVINFDQKRNGEKSEGLFGFSAEKNLKFVDLVEDTDRSKGKILSRGDSTKPKKNSKLSTNKQTLSH